MRKYFHLFLIYYAVFYYYLILSSYSSKTTMYLKPNIFVAHSYVLLPSINFLKIRNHLLDRALKIQVTCQV